MGVLSIDQIKVFLTIVEHGSFGKAARELRRHQSAVSYAITMLEQQLGVELFNREERKIKLTPTGEALLADARRISYSIDVLRKRAELLSQGTEAVLSIAIDGYCPLEPLEPALRDFAIEYPTVKLTVHVAQSTGAADMVISKSCMIGVVSNFHSLNPDLHQVPLNLRIPLDLFVANSHPLAAYEGDLEEKDIEGYIQLLPVPDDRFNWAKLSGRAWQTNDMRVMHTMLRAGVGWALMPHALVADDVAAGRLVKLKLAFFPGVEELRAVAVYHADTACGPAATSLLKLLANIGESGRQNH